MAVLADLQYYEDRLKFLRDERGKLEAARQEGQREGQREGLQLGRQEGKLAGKIQTLQEVLGDRVSTDEELLAQSVTALTTQLQLQRDRLNNRDAEVADRSQYERAR
jgi:flagellar biosynthesis/type III secretory pathway protein FliH